MTTCVDAVALARDAFLRNKKRAEDLAVTHKITKEGEVLADTIANMDEALSKLNEKDFTNLDKFDRQSLVTDMTSALLRAELTDSFEGAIAYNANSKTPRQRLFLRSAEFTKDDEGNDVLKVVVSRKDHNDYWEYYFRPNFNTSKGSKTRGTSLFIPEFARTHALLDNVVRQAHRTLTETEAAIKQKEFVKQLKDMLLNDSSILGSSDASEGFDYSKASKLKNYTHGHPQDMKNLLLDLHAFGEKHISKEQLNEYLGLLKQMHPHFFRSMNVYINENAEHTHGWVDLEKSHILLNKSSKLYMDMSNEEVYMHELVHTMTSWALQQEGFDASKLRNRLNYLRKVAFNKIPRSAFIAAHPNLTRQEAIKRYNYIFKEKDSNDEFIAFALTNPVFGKLLAEIPVREKVEGGLFATIKNFFADLMNAVMGNYTFKNREGNLKNEIHVLAFKLAEINHKADEEVKKGNIFSMIRDMIDSFEGSFEEFASGLTSHLDTDGKIDVPENPTPLQEAAVVGKVLYKSLYNKNARRMLGKFLTLWHITPDSSIREAMRNFVPDIEKYIEPELLNAKTNTIDSMRNTVVSLGATSITKNFSRNLTKEEEVALTLVLLDSNATTLFDNGKNQGKGYSDAQIAKLIADTSVRKKQAKRVEAWIKKNSKDRANWIIGQANGLGRLMATGKGHEAQMSNSLSIALGHGSDSRHKLDKKLLAMIEELAALRALDYQSKEDTTLVADLISSENKGTRNIVNLYESFKEDSRKALFDGDPSHMLEGYSKELFDDTIELRYEPLAEQGKLKDLGYTLVSEIPPSSLGGEPLGIYVSDMYGQPERLRGAVGLGNPHSRGLSLKDIRFKQFNDNKKSAYLFFEADKAAADRKAREINQRLAAGESFDSIEDGNVPIIDATGRTVDYRNMMGKRAKAKYLNQDLTITNVLSKTLGSVTDKVARNEQNQLVLEQLKVYAEKVYDDPNKDNLVETTLISETSEDPEIRKLFFMLPKSYQDYANSRKDKSIPVPSILMQQYFGYQHYQLTKLPGFDKLPNVIKHVLNMIEKVWLDLVKIAKGNILLKMPIILVGNVVSNVIYAWNTGMPLGEIVGAYRDSINEVRAFMKTHKDLEAAKIELSGLTKDYATNKFTTSEAVAYKEKVKHLKDKITMLTSEMEKSEVKELFDVGMYQAVIEDVNMYKLGDSNKISDGMDKLLKKTPTIVRTPLQILYLSKETAWYKANQEVLQLSDLVARDVMNRKQKWIEKEQANGNKPLPLAYRKLVGRMSERDKTRALKGEEREQFFRIAERSRHINLLHSFVNYTLPNGKGEEYLNRIGVLMFTKYFKRIQHVIADASLRHPIRSTITLAATAFLLDVDKIQDQALIVKAVDDNDFGLFGILPVYNPVDTLMRVVNPPLISLVTD